MLKSYYEILCVSSSASQEEIKIQFKKLVKMYHPDINSSVEAEEKFKEINRAYEVLSDIDKRKKYDSLRINRKENYSKKVYKKTNNSYSFSDFFQKKSKNEYKKREEIKPIKGKDIIAEVEIDLKEALLGTQRTVNISHSTICPKCFGHKFMNNQKCYYCGGLGEKIENKKIIVKIPVGIKNGSKLRIKGEGQEGKYGGERGNLYVVVKILEEEKFKIKDGIVYSDVFISPYTAILGGNVSIPTLWGEAIIKIPPLTKANQSFKLIDVGVLNDLTHKKGDQIVNIIIQISNDITKEEQQLYEKLKEISLKKRNANTIYN